MGTYFRKIILANNLVYRFRIVNKIRLEDHINIGVKQSFSNKVVICLVTYWHFIEIHICAKVVNYFHPELIHSLPLGTHCVFSTHAYCFARIVLITYAFTVKGRILLLPGILSEL